MGRAISIIAPPSYKGMEPTVKSITPLQEEERRARRFRLRLIQGVRRMRAWCRQVITLLPECKQLAAAADIPMALWMELHFLFDEAMHRKDWDLIRRFLKFAARCVSDQSGTLPNDTSSAAAVGFYVHLPERRVYWLHFPKWFSRSQFDDLHPVFGYHLKGEQSEELKRSYAASA